MSDFIKEAAAQPGPLPPDPQRSLLQDAGDKARRSNPTYWAERALAAIQRAQDRQPEGWAVDGLRNFEEINFFRQQRHFVLVAVDCQPADKRFARISLERSNRGMVGYVGGKEQFRIDDDRDRDDDKSYGQQVAKCVDDADILFVNDNDHEPSRRVAEIASRLERYVGLVLGAVSEPTFDERMMNLAYVIAEGSTCMRRQVGAVIVSGVKTDRARDQHVVCANHNENPPPLRACRTEFKSDARAFDGCYRDQKRFDDVGKVMPYLEQGRCPICKESLAGLGENPSLACPSCGRNLYKVFFGGRGNEHCTALHAEERAILHARGDLNGCTLFSTTFPCFLCTKKILEVGIARVVYVDPYPSPDYELCIDLLEKNHVAVDRFNGVKGKAFQSIFRNWEKTHIPGEARQ